MTEKELLYIRGLKSEEADLWFRLYELQERKTSISSLVSGPHGGTGEDKLSKIIEEYNEILERYQDKQSDILELEQQAEDAISSLQSPTERSVLRLYYLTLNENREPMKWKEVGEQMHYSRVQLFRIKDSAIQHLKDETQ